jgi:hypothetical protein
MLDQYQRVSNIVGEDDEDTTRLKEMAVIAQEYVTSFRWCPPIKQVYFTDGVGGIVAVFLVELTRKIQCGADDDDRLWVVVGDLPSAYLVVEPSDNPGEALERYCAMMEGWITAVRTGSDLRKVYPVEAPPTKENAAQLKSRLGFVKREVLPSMPRFTI